jgi:hypothetical protein
MFHDDHYWINPQTPSDSVLGILNKMQALARQNSYWFGEIRLNCQSDAESTA